MHFSYNGTRDWLKIQWSDQSYMKLEVVASNKHNKNSVTLRSSLLAFDLRETGLFERVCLVQSHYLLFLPEVETEKPFTRKRKENDLDGKVS